MPAELKKGIVRVGGIEVKPRVYLDTSVFSTYYNELSRERMAQTKAFWNKIDEFTVSTSDVTIQEIARTPDSSLRKKLEGLLEGITSLPLTR